MDSQTDEFHRSIEKIGKGGESAASRNQNCDSRTQYIISCRQCKTKYSNRQIYVKHFTGNHPGQAIIYGCTLCSRDFDDHRKFSNHYYRHLIVGRYNCDLCTKTFSQKCHLKVHIKISHVEPFSCEMCEKTFRTAQGMNRHVERCKSNVQSTPYKCSECGKVLYSEVGLWKHLNEHKFGSCFTCDLCDLRFTQKCNLKVHIENHHLNKREFGCNLCTKSFTSLSKLKEHAVLVHSECRKFSCTICNKTFKTERYMKFHFQQHNAKNAFTCKICDKGFTTQSKLKKHSVIHSDKKPFECRYCARGFNNYPNWLKHIRNVHKVDHKTGEPLDSAYVSDESKDFKAAEPRREPKADEVEPRWLDETPFDIDIDSLFFSKNPYYEKEMSNVKENIFNDMDDNMLDVYVDTGKNRAAVSGPGNSTTYPDSRPTLDSDDMILLGPTFEAQTSNGIGDVNIFCEDYINKKSTMTTSEILSKQELELSKIREMNGCETHNLDASDFYIYCKPDSYFANNILDQTTIFQMKDLIIKDYESMSYYIMNQNVIDANNLIMQSTGIFPSDMKENEMNYDVLPLPLDGRPAADDGNRLIDDKLTTSCVSTSLIFSNVDKSMTSGAECNV